MPGDIRIAARSLCIGLWLATLGASGASAQPSALCRDLAAAFAEAPERLDVLSLATLGTCVTTEIGERARVTGPPVPPAPQESTPQPPARQRGEWPAPAPWVENWPPQAPWDR